MSYDKLRERFREATLAHTAGSTLNWDQETYMPKKAADFRAEQLAWLQGTQHRLISAPEVADWLKACEDDGLADGDGAVAVNLRGWRRDYDQATKIPTALVEEITRVTSLGHHAWIEARQKSDFKIFAPHLEKIVSLCQQKADALGWEGCRYDALLDLYEPGAKTAEIARLFDDLGPKIAALIGPAAEKSARLPADVLAGHYPRAAQEKFNAAVAAALGFDFDAGRIDASTHPFCTELGPGDVRMTTRYDEADFLSSLYGVMHETGHGLYDQGLDKEHWGLPMGQSASLGIHESQSRLWENHVGRSVVFWEHWLPHAAELFPHLRKLSPETVAAAASRVEPSFIRVEADEVTYDQHIILRFTLERQIIGGDLKVAEIPAAWNEMFEKLIGLKVPDDARGCLQDIHWSFGGFGYFATYTLGNLNASQLMDCARREFPALSSQMRSGDYTSLLGFVRRAIHQHGRKWTPQTLMRQATGAETQSHHHLAYLQEKYC